MKFILILSIAESDVEEGFGGETTQENIEHEILEKKLSTSYKEDLAKRLHSTKGSIRYYLKRQNSEYLQ